MFLKWSLRVWARLCISFSFCLFFCYSAFSADATTDPSKPTPAATGTTPPPVASPTAPILSLPPSRIGLDSAKITTPENDPANQRKALPEGMIYSDQVKTDPKKKPLVPLPPVHEGPKTLTLKGEIGDFTSRSVEIITPEAVYYVPRKKLPRETDIRPGEKVNLSFTNDEWTQYKAVSK